MLTEELVVLNFVEFYRNEVYFCGILCLRRGMRPRKATIYSRIKALLVVFICRAKVRFII